MLKKILLVGLLLQQLAWADAAWAQSAVSTYPVGVTSTNSSGSITLTGAFQQVAASNGSRKACTIQNTSTGTMWVFFGAIGSATKATAYPLFPASAASEAGGFVSCNVGGLVLTDQVSITGTTAGTFTAAFQ